MFCVILEIVRKLRQWKFEEIRENWIGKFDEKPFNFMKFYQFSSSYVVFECTQTACKKKENL